MYADRLQSPIKATPTAAALGPHEEGGYKISQRDSKSYTPKPFAAVCILPWYATAPYLNPALVSVTFVMGLEGSVKGFFFLAKGKGRIIEINTV